MVGQFFRQGLRVSGGGSHPLRRELNGGRAAVGVLTWDSESEGVAEKLKTLGGTSRIFEVIKLMAENASQ